MKTPEKVYISDSELNDAEHCVIWFKSQQNKNDIEYVRKDAFIEKACKWLKNHYRDYMHNPTGERLEAFFGGDMCNDFEDYIKVE
jgi:hypothetical protein